ncbi:MAG TPA: hypothetical protein ACFYD3_02165 [Candidatus Hypogeohydataceae bacterium YC41]
MRPARTVGDNFSSLLHCKSTIRKPIKNTAGTKAASSSVALPNRLNCREAIPIRTGGYPTYVEKLGKAS